MKILSISKDGGPESNVTGYWLIEWKSLFSIALLKFTDGSREAYHSHAFNSISLLLSGLLREDIINNRYRYLHGLRFILTKRETFHKVYSYGTSWVLTFRGPWTKQWKEIKGNKEITLENGRLVVNEKVI